MEITKKCSECQARAATGILTLCPECAERLGIVVNTTWSIGAANIGPLYPINEVSGADKEWRERALEAEAERDQLRARITDLEEYRKMAIPLIEEGAEAMNVVNTFRIRIAELEARKDEAWQSWCQCRDREHKLEQRIAELEAERAKLESHFPLTKDGVRVTPGMVVYDQHGRIHKPGQLKYENQQFYSPPSDGSFPPSGSSWISFSDCTAAPPAGGEVENG